MRCRLLLLVFCLMPWNALSQPAGISRIDVTAYGIVASSPGVKDGVDSAGIEHHTSKTFSVIETTTRIPACLGVKFGIEFSIIGASDGMPVTLSEVYRYPPPGLQLPHASFPIRESQYERKLVAGFQSGIGTWYSFDNPWEVVPGEWTLELREGDRVLASKTFTVVRPKDAQCQNLSA